MLTYLRVVEPEEDSERYEESCPDIDCLDTQVGAGLIMYETVHWKTTLQSCQEGRDHDFACDLQAETVAS